jgi:hypothetical protein
LLLETANPELTALVWHGGLRGSGRSPQRQTAEPAGNQEQRDHRNTETQPGQGIIVRFP